MRGTDHGQTTVFSVISIEDRIPSDHPLRAMLALVNPVLVALSQRFDEMYSTIGRPSIPPERLLRALLLQVLYTIRSERQLMEQLDYNLLFRWFVGLNPDDSIWDPTVFTKNRDRLIEGNIADAFLQEILKPGPSAACCRTSISPSMGRCSRRGPATRVFSARMGRTPPSSDTDPSNPTVDFRKEKRSNATHESKTDPDARLARKSNTAAMLCHLGSVLMDNRHGLIVATDVRPPAYEAECDAAVEMFTTLEPRVGRRTLGADKGYDRPDLWRTSARVTRRRMSPRISTRRRRARSTTAPRATPDMRSVKSNGNWSKNASAGARRSAAFGTASPRPGEGELDFHLYECCLQPRAYADAHPRRGMHVSTARSAGVVSHDAEFEPMNPASSPPIAFPKRLRSSNSSIFPQPANGSDGMFRAASQDPHTQHGQNSAPHVFVPQSSGLRFLGVPASALRDRCLRDAGSDDIRIGRCSSRPSYASGC